MEAPDCPLIRKLLKEAEAEEQSGCFGRAEVCLRQAVALAQNSPLLVQAAAALGLFLRRFLPFSALPSEFLRLSLRTQQSIDASSPLATTLTLQLCESLIAARCFSEAEALLSPLLLDRDARTHVRVSVYWSLVLKAKGDSEEARKRLKSALDEATRLCPDSEELCEALFFSALLGNPRSKRKVLEQILPMQCSDFLWLRTARAMVESEGSAADDLLEKCVGFLEQRGARPSMKAALLVIFGDASSRLGTSAARHYREALRIYEDAGSPSWYVVWVKMKIDAVEEFTWTAAELAALDEELPTVPSIIALQGRRWPKRFFLKQYTRRLLQFADGDEPVKGDALFALSCLSGRSGRKIKGVKQRVAAYIAQYPDAKATACLNFRYQRFCRMSFGKLNACPYRDNRAELIENLQLENNSRFFLLEVANTTRELYAYLKSFVNLCFRPDFRLREARRYLDTAVQRYGQCTASAGLVEGLLRLGEYQLAERRYSEATASLERSLSISESLRPARPEPGEGTKGAKDLLDVARGNIAAEEWLRVFASAGIADSPESLTSAQVVFFLFYLYMDSSREREAATLMRQYIDRLPPASAHIPNALLQLGVMHSEAREYELAEPLLRRSVELFAAIAPRSTLVAHALEELFRVYELKKRARHGDPWLLKLTDDLLEGNEGSNQTASAVVKLRSLHWQDSSALGTWLQSFAGRCAARFSGSPASFEAQSWLLAHYTQTGQYEEALSHLPTFFAEVEKAVASRKEPSKDRDCYERNSATPISLKAYITEPGEESKEKYTNSKKNFLHSYSYYRQNELKDLRILISALGSDEFLFRKARERIRAAVCVSRSALGGALLQGLSSLGQAKNHFAETESALVSNAEKLRYGNFNFGIRDIRLCYGVGSVQSSQYLFYF